MYFEEEVASAKELIANKLGLTDVINPCNLLRVSDESCAGVYICPRNDEVDFYYGYKVVGQDITDYYVLRKDHQDPNTSNSNQLLNDNLGYHCIEYNPDNNSILSKYTIDYTGAVTEEIKYTSGGNEIQRNYIGSYYKFPQEWKDILSKISPDYIHGYTRKKDVNYASIKGLDFGI